MKIINFWVPVLKIAFDILPLCHWIIYDYNGIDVTVSNVGFFQEIDIEWKISFINTSCGGNAAMYEPLFMSLRIPRKKMKFLVNFNESFLLKHIQTHMEHRIILRHSNSNEFHIRSTQGTVILRKRLVPSLGLSLLHYFQDIGTSFHFAVFQHDVWYIVNSHFLRSHEPKKQFFFTPFWIQ